MIECQICGTALKTAISPLHLQGPKCCNREGRRVTVAASHELFGGVLRGGKVYAEGDVDGGERGRGLGGGEDEERATNRRVVRTRQTASIMSLVEKITAADIDAELDALETQIRQLQAAKEKLKALLSLIRVGAGKPGGSRDAQHVEDLVANYVSATGACTIGAISRGTNLSAETVMFHLEGLAAKGQVRNERETWTPVL